jgi:F-type H+-transporting ATPase subunit alpha
MTPVGRGQRELIIGDRKTGKTAIALDTIINQKDSGVICVYVSCRSAGQSTVAGVVEALRAKGAMDYTIVVLLPPASPLRSSTSPPTPVPRWPNTSCTRASDTLVVYDDLSKQAQVVTAHASVRPVVKAPGDMMHSRLSWSGPPSWREPFPDSPEDATKVTSSTVNKPSPTSVPRSEAKSSSPGSKNQGGWDRWIDDRSPDHRNPRR